MEESNTTTILWIQSIPDVFQTVMTCNGELLQPGSSRYINLFSRLTSQDLQKYKALSSTLKRLTLHRSMLSKRKRVTFLSGHFTQKDASDRLICYRALIVNAEDEEQECEKLIQEAEIYGCTITEEDKSLLRNKDNRYSTFIIIYILITLFIIITIWIINSLKIS